PLFSGRARSEKRAESPPRVVVRWPRRGRSKAPSPGPESAKPPAFLFSVFSPPPQITAERMARHSFAAGNGPTAAADPAAPTESLSGACALRVLLSKAARGMPPVIKARRRPCSCSSKMAAASSGHGMEKRGRPLASARPDCRRRRTRAV
ncbi:unnamed protein product, partial [Amoebophrya sp. A120]